MLIRQKTGRLFASGMRVGLIWELIFRVFCCGQYLNLYFSLLKTFPVTVAFQQTNCDNIRALQDIHQQGETYYT